MSGRIGVRVIVPVLAVLLLSISACGGKAAPDPTPVATGGPTGVLGNSELVDSVCTACHTRDRIDQANKDLAGWQSTINRMITQHGAKVTSEQQSAIALYLSNR